MTMSGTTMMNYLVSVIVKMKVILPNSIFKHLSFLKKMEDNEWKVETYFASKQEFQEGWGLIKDIMVGSRSLRKMITR